MTDIRKSPEQLDAEATGPLEERDIGAAIKWHRTQFCAEVGILRLHQRDGESGLGPPFTHPFVAFLDEQYGAFPWSRSLFFLRHRVCRTSHPEHHRLEWRGALCHELVNLVIRQDYSLDAARLKLGLPHEGKSRRTLDSALLVIERNLERLMSEQKPEVHRDPAEWMAPVHVHRPLGGLHGEECENPVCRRAA